VSRKKKKLCEVLAKPSTETSNPAAPHRPRPHSAHSHTHARQAVRPVPPHAAVPHSPRPRPLLVPRRGGSIQLSAQPHADVSPSPISRPSNRLRRARRRRVGRHPQPSHLAGRRCLATCPRVTVLNRAVRDYRSSNPRFLVFGQFSGLFSGNLESRDQNFG
jgi:hypothetical protein